MPIKLFSVQIDDQNKIIIATNTKTRAATILQSSVYYINQYSLAVDINSDIAKVALDNPHIIFKSKLKEDNWYKISP